MPQQINGDYKLYLHVNDPRSVNTFEKELGTLQINFNEGSADARYTAMRDDYKLLDKITNYFPPEEAQKGSIIPIIFALAISGLAFYYVSQVYTHQGNLNNMSFWGSIFVANYLLILLVIVAFWVKVNLVNTLWILLALSPITIYVMNRGLTPENCHISGFQKPLKSKAH